MAQLGQQSGEFNEFHAELVKLSERSHYQKAQEETIMR